MGNKGRKKEKKKERKKEKEMLKVPAEDKREAVGNITLRFALTVFSREL
jgi:hypothetical protein